MKTSKSLAKLLKSDLRELKRERKRLPKIIAQEAVDFFQDNFRRQGFVDSSLKKWKPRKKEDKTFKKKRTKRAILVKSGRLRGSVKRLRLTQNKIVIGSTVKYAKYHNFGLGKMPQRKFVGESRKLSIKIEKIIKLRIKRAFEK